MPTWSPGEMKSTAHPHATAMPKPGVSAQEPDRGLEVAEVGIGRDISRDGEIRR